jgi:hypothetical protein
MDREAFIERVRAEDPDATPMEFVYETPDRHLSAGRVRKIAIELRKEFQTQFEVKVLERDPSSEETKEAFVTRATAEVRAELVKKPKFAKFSRENDHKRMFEMITSFNMKPEDFARILVMIDLRENVERGLMTEEESMRMFLSMVAKRP